MKKKVYLDHAATTPVDQRVKEAMLPFLGDVFGNPSSLHGWGQEACAALAKARQTVTAVFDCEPREVIFTSGATEGNNLALKGVAEAYRDRGRHLVISPIEHHSVFETAHHLERLGYEITWLPVDKYGMVHLDAVAQAVRSDTILVSVMAASNEIGTMEPIPEIVKAAKQVNPEVVVHTDAVQMAPYFPLPVSEWGVDLLTITGHKFQAPKGVGAMYIRSGVKLGRLLDGGDQEFNLRAGTESLHNIVGLATALTLAQENQAEVREQIAGLRDRLIHGVLEQIDNVTLTGHPTLRLPHIASFVFANAEGESILLMLDQQGVAVSTGSACTSKKLEPSHVLLALGISPELAHGSIRFSLGRETTADDIDYVLKVLPPIIKRLRTMSPLQ